MKCTIISNGKLSLALTPDTEIEKLQLLELFGDPKNTLESTHHEKLQVLDKMLVNTIVINTKKSET